MHTIYPKVSLGLRGIRAAQSKATTSFLREDRFVACTRQTKVTLITTVVEFLHAVQKIRLKTVSQQESPTAAGNKDDMCITV